MIISCPIRVRITGMTLNNAGGSFPLLGAGETATACVDLLQNQFTVTGDMYARWASLTNHTLDNAAGTPLYNNQTYAAAKEPLMGTLDVALEGGFATTVPHYELVNPNRGDGSDGIYTVLNDSRIEAAIGTGPTDYGVDFGVMLGGVFGAGVYMLVDYDRRVVSLAKANLNPGAPDIRTVCSTNTSVAGIAPPANSSSSAASGGSQNGLDGGAIAGIVLGVLGFVATLIGVVYAALQYHFIKQKREEHRREEHRREGVPLGNLAAAENPVEEESAAGGNGQGRTNGEE
jgi:hypothetical protein